MYMYGHTTSRWPSADELNVVNLFQDVLVTQFATIFAMLFDNLKMNLGLNDAHTILKTNPKWFSTPALHVYCHVSIYICTTEIQKSAMKVPE